MTTAVEDEAQNSRNESQGVPGESDSDTDLTYVALRNEITQLKKNNAVIWDELLSLRAMFEKQAKLLPPEILHQIFLRATLPPFIFDASTTAGPQSPWCKSMFTKKSIVRVCKAWYTVGIGLLYEDVVFRHLSQIPAFLRTLETSPDTFGKLTLGIALYAVVDPCFVKSFNKHMGQIFDLCPRLCRFTFASPDCSPLPAALSVAGPPTHSEFNDLMKNRKILERISNSVVGLSAHAHDLQLDSSEEPSLCFPKLEDLTIRITPGSGPLLIKLSRAWSLPSLQRLSFVSERSGWPELEALKLFCAAHGRSLKFLDFHPMPMSFCDARITGYQEFFIQPLLDACPVLEHLILPSRVSPSVTHRTIKWVDVWAVHYSEAECVGLHTSLNNEMFPQLQGVRRLASTLSFLPSIPTLMHPSMVLTDQDTFEWDYPGIIIRHVPGYISGGRTIDIDSEEYGYKDESYVPPDDGDTSSDASSLSVVSETSHAYNGSSDDENLW